MNHALTDCEVNGLGCSVIDIMLMGGAGSSQAHDGRLDEGEPDKATNPVHGDGVGLSSFGADEGGQAFIHDGGFLAEATKV